MILNKLLGGEPPRDVPEKIGVVPGEVVAIGVWLMMFWVVYQAI